jgi:hypothetical protein
MAQDPLPCTIRFYDALHNHQNLNYLNATLDKWEADPPYDITSSGDDIVTKELVELMHG